MLSYLTRTLPVVARARLRRSPRLVSRLRRRVLPGQVDINLHMNQAAYLQVMELGRVDLLFGSGVWPRWRAEGVNPVVADQRVVYRRELAPFASYVVDSRAVAVEGRLLRCEHHLLVGDRVHARGEVSLIFVGPRGVLSQEDARRVCEDLLTDPLQVEDWRVVAG